MEGLSKRLMFFHVNGATKKAMPLICLHLYFNLVLMDRNNLSGRVEKMKKSMVICLLLILILPTLHASEGLNPNGAFISIRTKGQVENAFNQKKAQVMVAIQAMTRQGHALEWEVYSLLAQKIGKTIDPLEKLQHRLIKFTYKTVEKRTPKDGKILIEKNRVEQTTWSIVANHENIDQQLDNLLKDCSLIQLKTYLATLHRNILYFDVLKYALLEAPDSLWAGCAYAPVQAESSQVYYLKNLCHCYEGLWKAKFPKSYDVVGEHYEVGAGHHFCLFEPEKVEKGYFSYLYQAWSLLKACGKKYGRIKEQNMKLALAQPLIALCQYASSPDFLAVLDYHSERRIEYIPWYRHFNVLRTCRLLMKKPEDVGLAWRSKSPLPRSAVNTMLANHERQGPRITAVKKSFGLGSGREDMAQSVMLRLAEEKTELIATLETKSQKLEELERTSQTVSKERDSLRARLRASDAEVKRLSQQNEHLVRQYEAAAREWANSKEGPLAEENTTLSATVTSLESTIRDLRGQIHKLESENCEQKDLCEELLRRTTQIELSFNKISAKVAKQQKELTQADQAIQERAIELEQQQLTIQELNRQLKSKNAELCQLRKSQKQDTQTQEEASPTLEEEARERQRLE